MDGLRSEARVIFEKQKFASGADLPTSYAVVEIKAHDGAVNRFENRQVPARDIVSHVEQPLFHAANGLPPPRRLRLVRFNLRKDHTLMTRKDIFSRVFAAFGLDDHLLYMLNQGVIGYHQLLWPDGKRARDRLLPNTASFFFSNVTYFILWSYDFATLSTSAILIPRSKDGKDGDPGFDDFVCRLEISKNMVPHPMVLPYVAARLLNISADTGVREQLDRIREVERDIGVSPWSAQLAKVDISLGSEQVLLLNRISHLMSETVVALEDNLRHLKFALALQNVIAGKKGKLVWDTIPKDSRHAIRHTSTAMQDAISILQPQTVSSSQSISFLERRARNQIQMIFNLSTTASALAGINVASATRKDSSSMKVIALMTMAFLPATFIAALFSVPSLKWDGPDVIGGRFWVYWAFTMPTTAIVFLLWWYFEGESVFSFVQKKDPAVLQAGPRFDGIVIDSNDPLMKGLQRIRVSTFSKPPRQTIK